MTSQSGFQTIIIHIFPNSQGKGNQTMKFGQLIEYNKRNNFLQKSSCRPNLGTSCRPLSVFLKSFVWVKSKWSAA